jgi:hypothetical protein
VILWPEEPESELGGGHAWMSQRITAYNQIGLLVKPNLTSLARKALTLADEAVRSELAFGLTMPSLSSELASSLSGLFQRSARRAANQVGRPVGLSASDRDGPWATTRSGTWRARPSDPQTVSRAVATWAFAF